MYHHHHLQGVSSDVICEGSPWQFWRKNCVKLFGCRVKTWLDIMAFIFSETTAWHYSFSMLKHVESAFRSWQVLCDSIKYMVYNGLHMEKQHFFVLSELSRLFAVTGGWHLEILATCCRDSIVARNASASEEDWDLGFLGRDWITSGLKSA